MNKFFDERITEKRVEKIIKRVSRPEINDLPKYESFESCVEVLIKGIDVIKHNYSNNLHKRITLKISSDRNTLYYKPIDPQSKILAFFRGDRNLSFDNIKGFIYGPFSTTFESRKEKVINTMNFETSA